MKMFRIGNDEDFSIYPGRTVFEAIANYMADCDIDAVEVEPYEAIAQLAPEDWELPEEESCLDENGEFSAELFADAMVAGSAFDIVQGSVRAMLVEAGEAAIEGNADLCAKLLSDAETVWAAADSLTEEETTKEEVES